MLGVLLVSMTTGSGSIKISGANGTGRVGVTPKEDTHNYSRIDRQSGNSEVCKQKSQTDCKHSGSSIILPEKKCCGTAFYIQNCVYIPLSIFL